MQYGKRKISVQKDENKSATEFPLDGLAQKDEFLEILKSNKIKTIHSEEPTLEEIFIQIIGKSLI